MSTSAPGCPRAPHPAEAAGGPGAPVIFVVDDDSHVREAIRSVLEEDGRTVEDYEACEAFLEAYRPGREACLFAAALPCEPGAGNCRGGGYGGVPLLPVARPHIPLFVV